MRLLNVHSLEFREFYSERNLNYVIASHRWFKDEATYKDVQEKQNGEKAGFQKLRAFTHYIRKHIPSVEWLWIDTCCINKQDAQEVTEAINSMFRWYLNAAVCLAYLADVEATDDMDAFGHSVWFTRGWTLQELIASRTVVFLTRNWQVIGHKGPAVSCDSETRLQTGPSLEGVVASRTGIPQAVLQDCGRVQDFSNAEKMSWIRGRETTREEDMSYCLFGILDVAIGANYGEGGDRAKRRLLAAVSDEGRADLGALPIAADATYDSFAERGFATCLEGTRTQLLNQIFHWADNQDSKSLFWLCGKAGTGKSTIARTIAHSFDREQRYLGATFFFKRGEGDRRNAQKFFPTIAKQLAQKVAGMDHKIAQALKNDVCEKNLSHQFQHLILKPLDDLSAVQSTPQKLILIIDAMDECENSSDVRLVLELLARMAKMKSICLRIFVTIRPELPVQLGFRSMDGDLHQDLRLEEVQEATISHDIRAYFVHRFEEIRKDDQLSGAFNPLPASWPGESNIEILVDLAVPLFIFAFTICRFVAEADPQERLTILLHQRHLGSSSDLERTYLPILNQLIPSGNSHEEARALAAFRELMGTIIGLFEPLSAQSLSRLLQIPLREIDQRLRRLHSVLDIPSSPTASIRTFHLSFRDFLIGSPGEDRNRFSIDEKQTHGRLAKQCLQLLSRPGILRRDICDVEKPGTRRTDISKQRVENAIATEVAYACKFWLWHVHYSGERLYDNGYVHIFLKAHLLHWLEALSWLGSFPIDDRGAQLGALICDAMNFVLGSNGMTDIAPLQIYLYAEVFVPKMGQIGRPSEQLGHGWLNLLPGVQISCSPTEQSPDYDGSVTTTALSADGHILVVTSMGCTARVWNLSTGEEVHSLVGHKRYIYLAGFPQGRPLVLWASRGNQEWLWDTFVWDEIQSHRTSRPCTSTSRPESSPFNTSFEINGEWVQYRGEDVLMIPSSHRGRVGVHGHTLKVVRDEKTAVVSCFQLKVG